MFYHSKPPSNQHLVDIFVPSILSKSLVFLGGKGGGAGRVKNSWRMWSFLKKMSWGHAVPAVQATLRPHVPCNNEHNLVAKSCSLSIAAGKRFIAVLSCDHWGLDRNMKSKLIQVWISIYCPGGVARVVHRRVTFVLVAFGSSSHTSERSFVRKLTRKTTAK